MNIWNPLLQLAGFIAASKQAQAGVNLRIEQLPDALAIDQHAHDNINLSTNKTSNNHAVSDPGNLGDYSNKFLATRVWSVDGVTTPHNVKNNLPFNITYGFPDFVESSDINTISQN